MVTQEEINQWELLNVDNIIKWEVSYFIEFDLVTFHLKDKTVKEFKRRKKGAIDLTTFL